MPFYFLYVIMRKNIFEVTYDYFSNSARYLLSCNPSSVKIERNTSSKEAAARVEKLLRSAIANWEQKNERKAESGELFVTKIFVDGGATLKRMRPAPQGRGYRIRKRSNKVTLFVGAKSNNEDQN